MKFYKESTRLIFSAAIGLVAVLTYILLLEINGFEINESNLFILFMLPGLLIKLFLFFAALSLTITSFVVLFSKHKSKRLILYISSGLIIVLQTGITELRKIQSSNLYELTEDKSLDSTEVIKLYKKAKKKEDIRAISNIAIHQNLPSSFQERLSESEHIEVRRNIAWKTNSKQLLIKLSTDLEFEVRMAVASNKIKPLEIVYNMQNDPNEYVKNTAFAMYQARR
ncbi:hypothetical protein SAMN04489724_2652 [Algoriphagus locisalis]|uniref:Uncharacterized protein n=1 Tax=Algoriphagus locisalis TaxID=305507 RepID=A0A1I7BS68_9BACT|nr:hypothetical protein [Algoriphagus locisalis]SFT90035.1 hypothetical protein SAMN04489724_2652 [Algoriphagus locisalis]